MLWTKHMTTPIVMSPPKHVWGHGILASGMQYALLDAYFAHLGKHRDVLKDNPSMAMCCIAKGYVSNHFLAIVLL
jgi:hypothetical protein